MYKYIYTVNLQNHLCDSVMEMPDCGLNSGSSMNIPIASRYTIATERTSKCSLHRSLINHKTYKYII